MRILIVGDVVGRPGRDILKSFLNKNKEKYGLIIANGENAAGGFGIIPKIANEIFEMGVDIITSGNHIWDKKDIYSYLSSKPEILRPLNYGENAPGNGSISIIKNGKKIKIVNIQGKIFMPPINCPFQAIEKEISKNYKSNDIVIVDFHAEATSEKIAMGYYLDSKATIVFGTHTHVQTADERILEKGTAYITDVGMTGSADGVLGMKKDKIIQKFFTNLPGRFEIEKINIRLCGIEVELDDETNKVKLIDRLNIAYKDI